MNAKKISLIAILFVFLFACSGPNGSEYVGKWEKLNGMIDEEFQLQIVKSDNTFTIISNPGDKYLAILDKDGTLKMKWGVADIAFSYRKSSDTLMSSLGEYKRIK